MAITRDVTTNEQNKFIESDDVSGQAAIAVVNPDGSLLSTSTSTITPSTYAVDDTAMPATPKVIPVAAEYRASATTYTDGDATVLQSDINGNLKITKATLDAGEDLTNDVQKVENRYSYSRHTADGQVKAGAGFLHTLTFAGSDAAPTAGTIIVYDSLTETGTIIYSETFDTTIFRGYSVILDVTFATGLYIGFTTTADVGCTASYR